MKDQLSWLHHVLSPTNVCKKNWVQATMAWYGVSKYQCGVLLIDMNHVVCCCVMTRHTEVMVTFASLALKPWKCYKEIVEFGGWNDCGRSWKIYITQRYGCASKISSPKIQLVSYENSSISIWKETFDTQDHHISILLCYIYILPLNLLEMHCVIQPHLSKISTPTNCGIRVSDGFWINEAWYSSTRWPSTVEDRSTNPSEGRRASGWVMPWGWSARGNLFQVAKKTKRKGYHQDHEVPIRNDLFRWEGTDYKGVRSKNPQSWNWEELGILPSLNWWNMVKW